MIYEKFYNKVNLLKEQSEIIKIMFFYRYTSLIITSVFYLLSNWDHSFGKKVFIVACISIASIIINYLLIMNANSTNNIILLVLIETIGNSIILIPSGGLNSPYVWYSLNTILIASIKLNRKYCWMNIFIYLFSSTYISGILLEDRRNLVSIITQQSNLILSFVLITAAIQLLAKYAKRSEDKSNALIETNIQLVAANTKIKESINYIMALYQTVQLFTAQENRNDLTEIIIEYSKKIMKVNSVIFLHKIKQGAHIIIKSQGLCKSIEEEIHSTIVTRWKDLFDSENPIVMEVKDKTFIFAAIRCNYEVYGILGIEMTGDENGVNYEETIGQLKFIANLGSITLENLELEKVNEELIVNEEQNRIANEIHDGILQRLFSISCNMFETIKNLENISIDEIEAEFNRARASMNGVMKDLRATIYGLSWKKEGINNFITNIENYINEIKLLNNIEISFKVEGNHELLSTVQKKAIYRIICESIGNAIRHGKAKYIDVILSIGQQTTFLEVVDNGIGFDMKALEREDKMGLGVKNIYQLTHSLKGVINLHSEIGIGTKIDIRMPNDIQELYEEEIV